MFLPLEMRYVHVVSQVRFSPLEFYLFARLSSLSRPSPYISFLTSVRRVRLRCLDFMPPVFGL